MRTYLKLISLAAFALCAAVQMKSQILPPQDCQIFMSWKGGDHLSNPSVTVASDGIVVASGIKADRNSLASYHVMIPVGRPGLVLTIHADAVGDYPAADIAMEAPSIPHSTQMCSIEVIVNPIGKSAGKSGAIRFHIITVTP